MPLTREQVIDSQDPLERDQDADGPQSGHDPTGM